MGSPLFSIEISWTCALFKSINIFKIKSQYKTQTKSAFCLGTELSPLDFAVPVEGFFVPEIIYTLR